jgi:hypothetical protein
MPTYQLSIELDAGAPHGLAIVSHSLTPAAPAHTALTLDQLISLYTQVGEHERHYSTIRMAATSLLFTIAVAAVAGVYDKMLFAATIGELATYATAPVLFLGFSLIVNIFYSRISTNARQLEQHLENLINLHAQGTPYPITQPNVLFFRTFERYQSSHRWKKSGRPPRNGSIVDYARHFEQCVQRGQAIRARRYDTPFWIVASASAAILAGLLWVSKSGYQPTESKQEVSIAGAAKALESVRDSEAETARHLSELHDDLVQASTSDAKGRGDITAAIQGVAATLKERNQPAPVSNQGGAPSQSAAKPSVFQEEDLSAAGWKKLQSRLTARGSPAGAPDGKKGPTTIAAIKAFQTKEGAAATGILTSEQIDSLLR